MKCTSPRTMYYRDLLGARHAFLCPCGKCIACLHNQQDSWAIRALETTKAKPVFVYDTLTFRTSALPMVELCDILDANPDIVVSEQSAYMLQFYNSCPYTVGKSSRIPYVDRQIIRDWIRRGRENYVYDHSGKRPDWKYMVCMEYGPKTSRPHFHLLFWGISQVDYKKYFGIPWFERFGRTKPSYFNYSSTPKDRECITRYISKYCSKGVFESPWVRDGILPKPFKCVSQGLGVEYLQNSKFDYFLGVLPLIFKDMSINEDFEPGRLQRTAHVRNLLNVDIMEGHKVPESALDALSVYYDSLGRPHSLPRYYKQKLLNLLHPNVFSYTLQTLLLARADLHTNKAIQRLGNSLGLRIQDKDLQSPSLGLSRRLYNLLCDKYAFITRVESRVKAKGRYTLLKNHYLRPARGAQFNDYGVTSSFLALVC